MFICFSVTGVHMFLVLITSSTMLKRSTDASEMLVFISPARSSRKWVVNKDLVPDFSLTRGMTFLVN